LLTRSSNKVGKTEHTP